MKLRGFLFISGAGNETRTRDLYLGKVSLYQLSYSRKKRSPHYIDAEFYVKKIDTLFCKEAKNNFLLTIQSRISV